MNYLLFCIPPECLNNLRGTFCLHSFLCLLLKQEFGVWRIWIISVIILKSAISLRPIKFLLAYLCICLFGFYDLFSQKRNTAHFYMQLSLQYNFFFVSLDKQIYKLDNCLHTVRVKTNEICWVTAEVNHNVVEFFYVQMFFRPERV